MESLKTLVEDESFIKALENERNEEERSDEENLIKDVKDGTVYKSSKYFTQNPEAFSLMLYSNGVELVNPLASLLANL